jgi:hypothetical protein
MDGDGSMRPQEIPLFLEKINKGADIVKGSRFTKGGASEDISTLRKFGNTLFTKLVNLFWGTKFTDLCYGFFAINNKSAKILSPILVSKGFSIETELMIKAIKHGFIIEEVPSFELERGFGVSNLNWFWDGWSILITIIKEAISK